MRFGSLQGAKKFFYLFLIINAFLWIIVPMFRNLISPDAMEAVVWGNLLSLGTNKHPPLSGWLAGSFYWLAGENNIGIYILGQICIIIGLVFIYKLAKNFLSEKKAILASLIMAPCSYYTYQAFYDNFNCNYISFPLYAMLVYCFYKTLKSNILKDWLILGLVTGICLLAKYQVVFLLFGMFLYMLIYERKYFKQKEPYIAILIALIVFSPHLYWLYQNDFFSFIYLIGRTESVFGEGHRITLLQRLIFPTKFYLDQLMALAPCFILYLILAIKEKNILAKKFNFANKEACFLLLIGVLPLIIIGSMGIFTTSRIVGAWGSPMVSFIGILLFYFFPIELSESGTKFFKKWIIGLMCAWVVAMFIFVQLQTKIDMACPYQKIIPEINKIWADATNNAPLKYVKGDNCYIFQFQLYGKQKTTAVLDTYGYKNPWVNEKDINESGCVIIVETFEQAKSFLKEITVNEDIYEIKKFEYEIKNTLNKTKHFEFYYIIIPPTENGLS